MKKVLVLNISTDSKNTSLGFAISWLNAFAKKFDEVHVISLSKGSDDELEKNVVVSSVDNELGRISKIINLYKFFLSNVPKCSYFSLISLKKYF